MFKVFRANRYQERLRRVSVKFLRQIQNGRRRELMREGSNDRADGPYLFPTNFTGGSCCTRVDEQNPCGLTHVASQLRSELMLSNDLNIAGQTHRPEFFGHAPCQAVISAERISTSDNEHARHRSGTGDFVQYRARSINQLNPQGHLPGGVS